MYIHGMSHTRLFKSWVHMRERCYNPKDKRYSQYGGRGITVCDEWKNEFLPFYEWAMANGYDDNLTIDRIDVNKGYCPQNCRWADMRTQQNNRSNNHRLEYKGENHTINEWSRLVGIRRQTILRRIKDGWSVEDALTKPPMSASEAGRIGTLKRWELEKGKEWSIQKSKK